MLSVAILAGGKSRRMGQDKALMPFLGRPLIARVVERMRPLSDDMFVMTTRPADYAFLDIPIHSDLVRPGQGSLAGLCNSLLTAREPFVAIVGCDMPFANPALFAYEQEVMNTSGADVVIPSTSLGLEPLHAVYRRAACLPVLQAALEAGERKIIAWFPEVKVHILTDEVTAQYDQHQLTFWNLNTPEEYRQAEARARLEESF